MNVGLIAGKVTFPLPYFPIADLVKIYPKLVILLSLQSEIPLNIKPVRLPLGAFGLIDCY